MNDTIKKMYLAGGCFWGLEELMRTQEGVVDTEVGYTGGDNDDPSYRNHPGHAEALEIQYDTTKTTFKKILEYFYRVHNPTTIDQQGNDRGSSYRSAIFYQDEQELLDSKEVIAMVDESKKWDGKVVTTLEPYTKFYVAEDYHQDYLQKSPLGYTCHQEYFDNY